MLNYQLVSTTLEGVLNETCLDLNREDREDMYQDVLIILLAKKTVNRVVIRGVCLKQIKERPTHNENRVYPIDLPSEPEPTIKIRWDLVIELGAINQVVLCFSLWLDGYNPRIWVATQMRALRKQRCLWDRKVAFAFGLRESIGPSRIIFEPINKRLH